MSSDSRLIFLACGNEDTGFNALPSIRCLQTRYLAVLAYERRELRPKFSPAECGLILDACNGVAFFDSFSVRLFPEGVRDAIEMEELDAKWQVDGPALLAKLDATTFSQRMAFVDAVQRWWNRTTEPGEPPQYGELLADPTPDREIGQIY